MLSSRVRILVISSIAFFLVIIGVIVLNPSLLNNLIATIFGKPHPGSCVILEEKNCKNVKFVYDRTHTKADAVFAVPAGSYLFAPADGDLSNGTAYSYPNGHGGYDRYTGSQLFQSPDGLIESLSYTYSFVYSPATPFTVLTRKAKKGDIIAQIGSQPIKQLGNYNLVVYLSKQTKYEGIPGSYPPHQRPVNQVVVDATKDLIKLLTGK